jgi:hypothetical protein
VFAHNGAGHLLGGPLWLDIPAPWEDADQAFAGDRDEAPARLAKHRGARESGFDPGARLLLHTGP